MPLMVAYTPTILMTPAYYTGAAMILTPAMATSIPYIHDNPQLPRFDPRRVRAGEAPRSIEANVRHDRPATGVAPQPVPAPAPPLRFQPSAPDWPPNPRYVLPTDYGVNRSRIRGPAELALDEADRHRIIERHRTAASAQAAPPLPIAVPRPSAANANCHNSNVPLPTPPRGVIGSPAQPPSFSSSESLPNIPATWRAPTPHPGYPQSQPPVAGPSNCHIATPQPRRPNETQAPSANDATTQRQGERSSPHSQFRRSLVDLAQANARQLAATQETGRVLDSVLSSMEGYLPHHGMAASSA